MEGFELQALGGVERDVPTLAVSPHRVLILSAEVGEGHAAAARALRAALIGRVRRREPSHRATGLRIAAAAALAVTAATGVGVLGDEELRLAALTVATSFAASTLRTALPLQPAT